MTLSDKDAELMFQLDQDPEVMRYVTNGKLTTREEIKNTYLPRMAKYTNPTKGWGLWKVHRLDTAEFIGWILVRPKDFFSQQPEMDNLELGWRFFRSSWGKGYATEAVSSIIPELIANQAVQKLSAIAIEENTASTNIMRKLGMGYIGKGIHKDPLGEEEVVFYERIL